MGSLGARGGRTRRLFVRMRSRRARLLLLLGVAAFSLSMLVETHAAAKVESGFVLGVKDGDTITVLIGDVEEDVRLIGVSAPELTGESARVEAHGLRAREFVIDATMGKEVELRADSVAGNRGSRGRLLRFVYLSNGTCLNEALIRRGYAYALMRYPFSEVERYRDLESEACRAGVGLWGANGLEPIGACASGAADLSVFVTPHGRKYHRATCRYVGSEAIELSVRQAVREYEPCSVCDPPSPLR